MGIQASVRRMPPRMCSLAPQRPADQVLATGYYPTRRRSDREPAGFSVRKTPDSGLPSRPNGRLRHMDEDDLAIRRLIFRVQDGIP